MLCKARLSSLEHLSKAITYRTLHSILTLLKALLCFHEQLLHVTTEVQAKNAVRYCHHQAPHPEQYGPLWRACVTLRIQGLTLMHHGHLGLEALLDLHIETAMESQAHTR